MTSINKQTCPTCGQSVNQREISLYKGLVVSLYKVWRYCEESGQWSLGMSSLRSLLGQIDYSRMNDWKRFEPDMVSGKRGEYNFDKKLMRELFTGERKVCTVVLKDPLAHTLERTEFKTLHDVPSLNEFLNEEESFVANYRGEGQLRQANLMEYL